MTNEKIFDLEGAFPIDVDFESYEVPMERANAIREELASIKLKKWLSNLFGWVHEKGTIAQVTEQGNLLEPARCLAWPPEHALSSVQILLDGTELEIKLISNHFLTLQQLPKSDELLISKYSSDQLEAFSKVESILHDELKIYLKDRSDRFAKFQKKN